MRYSRDNPSKKYLDLIKEYKIMHNKGYVQEKQLQKKADNCYDGKSTIWFSGIIKNIIEENNCQSLLDYGCGKALYYKKKFIFNNKNYPGFKKYWKMDDYFLYDPAYKKYSKLPKQKYECSICIDVLEHLPIEDLSWVIKEIISYTKKITFFNIACFPAFAVLYNGENAHATIKHPKWWQGFFTPIIQEFPKNKIICYCTMNTKKGQQYYAFSFNDDFKKYDKINFK